MPFMGFLIIMMAASTGTATFIENDYGPAAARAMVYNAWWFEVLLLLIMINLLGNMIQNKIYRKRKFTIFLFHFAFLFIFIGAAVTRYVSYEGSMHIREGKSSDQIMSGESHFYGSLEKNSEKVDFYKSIHLISGKKNRFKEKASIGGQKFNFKLLKFIPRAKKTLIPDPSGKPVVTVVILGDSGREEFILNEGESIESTGNVFGFNHNRDEDDFFLYTENNKLYFVSKTDVLRMDMAANSQDTLTAGDVHLFKKRTLYSTDLFQIVMTDYLDKSRVGWIPGGTNEQNNPDALVMEISGNGAAKEVTIFGKADRIGMPVTEDLNGTKVTLTYGSRMIQLPFSLYLKNFELERYPGSNSPASFASEVTLIDNERNIEKPYRIFMNNILNYRGFRFFQSSYDTDEMGTILSVNHDSMGTMITYIGYFLMTLGMILSVFNKNSRFLQLARSGNNTGSGIKSSAITAIMILVSLSFSLEGSGQVANDSISKLVPKEHATEFASVLVQDQGGRIKPVQSMASDIIRKVAKKERFMGLDPMQVIMGMYFFPEKWQQVPMIKVSNVKIRKELGIQGKYGSFYNFFDMASHGSYKLTKYVQEAYQKKPGLRTKFDQEIMKVDERVNVCYMVYSGSLLRIFPVENDPNDKWYSPTEAKSLVPKGDSLFVSGVMGMLQNSLSGTMDVVNTTEIIKGIKKYQEQYAIDLIPPGAKISLEIFYLKAGIFQKLSKYYGLIGFVLLILLFVNILSKRSGINRYIQIATVFLILGFIMHTVGLGIRWYVSGHAPMSNGYESMIFIAWAAMLAGLLFVKKSSFAIVAASILSALTLAVAHMSWMNPEITNLVPVLKSYWLTIHVSVIISSYGFLGIGMVLGFLNLILYVMKTKKNHIKLQNQIKVLSDINEMSLILGVYLITIGTFLGAVWANESWGRYWGWDPKETWALITALVYIFITHMRLIPGLKGYFAFNLASVVGFFSVLMTYFGVNYYLAGLHSYAQGDAVPVPKFVYYTLITLTLVILFSWFNEKKYRELKKQP